MNYKEFNGQLSGMLGKSEQVSIVQESLCQIRWDWSDPRGWLKFANEALDVIRKEFPELKIKGCEDFEMEES